MVTETTDLRSILLIAQDQFTSISIKSMDGEWSPEYYTVLEVKDIASVHGQISMVILQADALKFIVIDIMRISEIRFNKLLFFQGELIEGAHVKPVAAVW